MPDLDTSLHRNMLKQHRRQHAWPRRVLRRLLGRMREEHEVYGLQWGDPDSDPHLIAIRKRFLDPYLNSDHVAVEIGPGGGRWTRYMLPFRTLYAVDYYQELLVELQRHFRDDNIIPIHNNGTDFPNIADHTVDFLFSFGTFVHLELNLIDGYLNNMRRILKPGANVVIQYGDKTKKAAQDNEGFADNTPTQMRELIDRYGFTILEEDLDSLKHSAVVRFTPGESEG